MVQIEREIAGYRAIERIGAGGTGVVFRAISPAGEEVALKILHPAVAANPLSRQRLQREVAMINRLSIPGVVPVLDVELDGEPPFIVTELVEGFDIAGEVRQQGPWEKQDLADLARRLKEIIERLHAAGIIHRDLKPSNVMLAKDGPMLVDFGTAQVEADERLTQTGLVSGTPGYVSPEVLAGQDPDRRGDWWGWAALLLYCATGRGPFGEGNPYQVVQRTMRGEADLAGLDEDLSAAFAGVLHPDPAQRTDPDTFIAELEGEAPTRLLPPPVARTQVLETPVMEAEVAPTMMLPAEAEERQQPELEFPPLPEPLLPDPPRPPRRHPLLALALLAAGAALALHQALAVAAVFAGGLVLFYLVATVRNRRIARLMGGAQVPGGGLLKLPFALIGAMVRLAVAGLIAALILALVYQFVLFPNDPVVILSHPRSYLTALMRPFQSPGGARVEGALAALTYLAGMVLVAMNPLLTRARVGWRICVDAASPGWKLRALVVICLLVVTAASLFTAGLIALPG